MSHQVGVLPPIHTTPHVTQMYGCASVLQLTPKCLYPLGVFNPKDQYNTPEPAAVAKHACP